MSGATTGSLSKLIQSPQDGTLEGWRVVLTIILRYGLGQKQSSERDIFAPEGDSEDPAEQTETDEVKAMVADVKSRGVSETSSLGFFFVFNLSMFRERIY